VLASSADILKKNYVIAAVLREKYPRIRRGRKAEHYTTGAKRAVI
jgi:hypothetical protein